MKVSAVVVTYNRLNILKNCLKHLLSQNYKLDNIVVINNNSSDGTKEYLNNLHNNRILVKNMHKNVGGSGGFSEGIRLAFEDTNSDAFWLMDDDSAPTVNALSKLILSVRKLHNKFGFLCSNVRSQNNMPVNVPMVNSRCWTELLPSNLIRIKEASFVSLLIPRQVVSMVGLPVRQMFIWGDDSEYTLRISQNKYKGYLVDNSIVIHESVDSNKGSKQEETVFNTNRIKFFEYSYRNYLYIMRKHYTVPRVIKRLLTDIKELVKIPFKSKNKRLLRFYYVSLGIIKGFFFNPKIEFPHNKNNNK